MSPLSPPSTEDPKIAAARLKQRAHNRDGLPELVIGFDMLVFAVLALGSAVFPKGSPLFIASVLGFALLGPALTMAGPSILRRIRGRCLVSRFGYVRPRRMERKTIGYGALFAVGIAAAMFLGTLLFQRKDQWILLMTGFLGGALQIWLGWLFGLSRFVVKGLFYILSAAVLSLAGMPLQIAMSAWFGGVGLIELVSGAVVFRRFLAQHPATEETDGQ